MLCGKGGGKTWRKLGNWNITNLVKIRIKICVVQVEMCKLGIVD
jgi:hypothetical protein